MWRLIKKKVNLELRGSQQLTFDGFILTVTVPLMQIQAGHSWVLAGCWEEACSCIPRLWQICDAMSEDLGWPWLRVA